MPISKSRRSFDVLLSFSLIPNRPLYFLSLCSSPCPLKIRIQGLSLCSQQRTLGIAFTCEKHKNIFTKKVYTKIRKKSIKKQEVFLFVLTAPCQQRTQVPQYFLPSGCSLKIQQAENMLCGFMVDIQSTFLYYIIVIYIIRR